MVSIILWLLFIAYIIYLFHSKKWKAILAAAREEGSDYNECYAFFLKRGLIALAILTLILLVIVVTDLAYDDFESFFPVSIFSWLTGLMFAREIHHFVITGTRESGDRQERSGKPSEKRSVVFYLLTAAIAVYFPASVVSLFFYGYDFIDFLTYAPLVAVVSAVMFSTVVSVSNMAHNIGIRDFWSKASIVYWVLVALPFPYCCALLASQGKTGDYFWIGHYTFDGTLLFVCAILFTAVAYCIFYLIIAWFSKWTGGIKSAVPFFSMTETSSSRDYSPGYYFDPDDSGHKTTSITDDYYGKHGEFDINDEARRVSEDMQQFHNTFPDSDLSDQYYWDDILDAETDDYLDD